MVEKARKTWAFGAAGPLPEEGNTRATEDNTPEPVANVAQPLPSEGNTEAPQKSQENLGFAQPVAHVALVARENKARTERNEEHDERAAIVERDGGAPREWAEGFAGLDCAAPAPGYSLRQWEQLINDGGRFLDQWAGEAIRLGWTAEDVFGVHPGAPGARVDAMGLVPLISSGEVISITAERASIRMPGGSTLTYLRRPRPGAVVLWELGA